METGVTLTGDWFRVPQKLHAFTERLQEKLRKATLQNAVGLKGQIQEGIVNQAPGGHRLAAISSATAMLRGDTSGTGKALLDHGDLLAAIAYVVAPDGMSARVGVKRSARQEGKDLNNIAAILTKGAHVKVTPKMRAWLHYHGVHLKPETVEIIIPPRPFLEPAYYAYREKMRARYKAAIAEAHRETFR